ncbi:molybdopterin-dependent oxidoreductase [Methanoplanus sp. FWC-SCC4]|uniref:Molybdopterin-dependent oxidoreductase n=2 Tax=Methanochimaera problematica TaxID=2609417 RepID=A0AA97I4Y7_9EURY|nr:molybdopterin-dependent oxidoreductase [Methanoplanus sp. FWC-SCC4]
MVIFSGCTQAGDEKSGQDTNAAIKGNLTLTGSDGIETVYSYDEILEMQDALGYGYSVSTVGIKYGPYECRGVPLTELIQKAGGMKENDSLWISANDGYMWVFDYDQVNGRDFITLNPDLKEIEPPELKVILMYEQDKEPLSYNDGAPFRIAIISDSKDVITEGSSWVKWVEKIEIKGGNS